MELSGEYRLPAPRAAVWRALNDPAVLKLCIPGCETLEKRSETEFAARVKSKIGPVAARFAGTVALEDIDAPAAYTLRGEGEGGVAGFVKGHARISLEETLEGTALRYVAEAHVGGKLAQLGSRLLVGTARKLAGEFFDRFAAHLGAGPAAEPTSLAVPGAAEGA